MSASVEKPIWQSKAVLIPVILIAAVVLIAGFYFIGSGSSANAGKSQVESDVLTALQKEGFQNPSVNINSERALISLSVSDESTASSSAFFAMGAAAIASPETKLVTVEVLKDGVLILDLTASTRDVLALANGEMIEEEFQARLKTS